MRIHVSDRELLDELVSFLRAAECLAERASETEIDVRVPRAFSEEQARKEVALYLAAWRAMYPGAEADLT